MSGASPSWCWGPSWCDGGDACTCRPPDGKQALPPGVEVVAPKHLPANRGFLVTYLGRQPGCKSHAIGVSHAPCWSIVRLDFDAPPERP